MTETIIEHCIIDVLENGIWDIGEDQGKIKCWAIKKLSKAVNYKEMTNPSNLSARTNPPVRS